MTEPHPFIIVHADDELVVVDKPSGLLTVPAHGQPCLVDLLEAELDRKRYGRHRLAVVHRLDRLTSGLLVFARTPTAASLLAKQFAAHSVEREYAALVAGQLPDARGTTRDRLDGKHAVTHYERMQVYADATAVAVHLETGRRNQIRRHFAERGHPLLGDVRFGYDPALHAAWPHPRVALHARILGFVHPRGKALMHFESATPEVFRRACEGRQQ